MMSFRMKVLSVLLIILSVQDGHSMKCPVELGKDCESSFKCTRKERCYRDLDGTPNKKLHYCCRMSCPVTKLLTFHSPYDDTYLHKMDDKMSEEGLYYNDATLSIACPYPYSHVTIKIDKVLPVGFSVNSATELKNCNTNGDCGEGFYCGYSVNPSFLENHAIHIDIRRTAADQSNRGNPIKFCYKNPNVDSKFVIAFDASGFSLPICNEHSECLGMGAICYRYGEANDIFLGRNEKAHRGGLCVKVRLCDSNSNQTEGVFTKNGSYCANANDCDGIRDETFVSQCVQFEHTNTTSGGLCCFRPKLCDHGTAIFPKQSCSSNVDCNAGTYGAWSSWCGPKGFCCNDTTGTVEHLCPDRATLSFNEPPCQGKCENGTCINGRCCPGLVIEDGRMVKLGASPYITKMPCDPTKPLPSHVRLSYCSRDGFITVIGSNDVFGDPFVLNGKTECLMNAECDQEGDMSLCIRGNLTSSACNKDPFQSYSKSEDSWLSTVLIYIIVVVIVVICLVAVELTGCFGIRKKGEHKQAFQTNVRQRWKTFACLNNLPAFNVKCVIDYGGWFMTKVDYVVTSIHPEIITKIASQYLEL